MLLLVGVVVSFVVGVLSGIAFAVIRVVIDVGPIMEAIEALPPPPPSSATFAGRYTNDGEVFYRALYVPIEYTPRKDTDASQKK